MASEEETTYAGRYYRVAEAMLNPRPVQAPRPPIVVAVLGPRMMRHAAQYADSWNSLSFRPTFKEQLAETRAGCAAIAYHDSRECFMEQVSRVVALGVSDVGLYYPLDPAQRDMFERIASEVLPALRPLSVDLNIREHAWE